MRRIAVLDAPSNLGLRPPTATSVPGCAKAPGALRDHGLLSRLGARDVPVPERISVVGCDDIGMSAMTRPALTTVSVPKRSKTCR